MTLPESRTLHTQTNPENETSAKADSTGLKVRELALEFLLTFERQGKHRLKVDQVLEGVLKKSGKSLTTVDRGLLHTICISCLRWQVRLDGWITLLSGRPLKQIEPVVRCLLRLGLIQLHGLDQIPAYAAVDTTVTLAKKRVRSTRTIKFVNAILREAQRRLDAGTLPIAGSSEKDSDESSASDKSSEALPETLTWQAGWPTGWTETLLKTYSPKDIQAMAIASCQPSSLVVRINTLKTDANIVTQALDSAGVAWEHFPAQGFENASAEFAKNLLLLPSSGVRIQELPGYADGWFYVQDAASYWVACLVEPKAGDTILDMCAAPGSKTSAIAALANNQADIVALEPIKDRVARLKENLERLGCQNVQIIRTDALSTDWEAESPHCVFDSVLVDAPCSGSGTIRRHPEILRHLSSPRLKPFIEQQMAVLKRGFDLLKPGGTLVYSTCSILPDENHNLVARFLAKEKSAQLLFEEQRHIAEHSDGFYAAKLQKSP